MKRAWLATLALGLAFGVMGCANARLVSWSGDSGVVAIPTNSDIWPSYERTAAVQLMAEKCPNGYEIVEEGEVVVGKKTTTSDTVDRKPTGSGDKAGTRTAETSVTSTTNQTEYRIKFRSKNVGAGTSSGKTTTETTTTLSPQPEASERP